MKREKIRAKSEGKNDEWLKFFEEAQLANTKCVQIVNYVVGLKSKELRNRNY